MNVTNATTTTPPAALVPSTGYVNALQVCAAILAMVVFGFFWRAMNRVGPTKEFNVAVNAYMFLVGIPTLVFQGLAVQKFNTLPWTYVAVFFCLRAALFVLWALIDLLLFRRKLGEFVADYMNSTWINTVIFGIPIFNALYGAKYAVYPIFASISSFFFQLPVQLLLFELERMRKAPAAAHDQSDGEWSASAIYLAAGQGCLGAASSSCSPAASWGTVVRILIVQVLLNPIMIAIVAGILWSLTGWTLPLFLTTICQYCGDSVTPLSAFAIGVFMFQKLPSRADVWVSFAVQMLVKIFVMPLLVMPFLLAFSITGPPLQMGVLMAALPVALSCYVLSVTYGQNEQLSSMMVVGSTILLLPVQLMWIAITNSMGWGTAI